VGCLRCRTSARSWVNPPPSGRIKRTLSRRGQDTRSFTRCRHACSALRKTADLEKQVCARFFRGWRIGAALWHVCGHNQPWTSRTRARCTRVCPRLGSIRDTARTEGSPVLWTGCPVCRRRDSRLSTLAKIIELDVGLAKLGGGEMLPAWKALAVKVPDLMAEVHCA